MRRCQLMLTAKMELPMKTPNYRTNKAKKERKMEKEMMLLATAMS